MRRPLRYTGNLILTSIILDSGLIPRSLLRYLSNFKNLIPRQLAARQFIISLAIALSGLWLSNAYAFPVTRITNNSWDDTHPSLHNGQIAWQAEGGKIYYWDGSDITLVVDSWPYNNQRPSLYNGTIAWVGWTYEMYDWDIFYWDGNSIQNISKLNNSRADFYPSLYDGAIAWSASDGNDEEIFYWDGSTITQITDNTVADTHPSLYDGKIAWGNNSGVYYWDGTGTTKISSIVPNAPVSLYDGTIAWSAWTTDSEGSDIFYWDGSSVSNISSNQDSMDEYYPSLYNGTITWQQHTGGTVNPYDIFYWDGSTISQVTNNDGIHSNRYPSLHNGMIAWENSNGEIYLTVVPEPYSVLLLGSGLLALGWGFRKEEA